MLQDPFDGAEGEVEIQGDGAMQSEAARQAAVSRGLDTLKASGSAQYSKPQLEAMISAKKGHLPMVIVDLRQEAHRFLRTTKEIENESTVAVGWFVERDWINIGKGLVSVEADEQRRLASLLVISNLTVFEDILELVQLGSREGSEGLHRVF